MTMVGQFLLLVLCALPYNVAGDQVITDHNALLVKGSEASLQCSFRGTPLQLYWLKEEFGLGDPALSKADKLIRWYSGRTQGPKHNSGKFNVSEKCSLTFTAEIGDAGRYYCVVSNDKGIEIWGYTDVTVVVPPVDPFPIIENFTISDVNRPTTITCRAYGASIGLVALQWMHNDDEYPQINRNITNADGTTENLTATIEALVSEEPYICVGTLNATKLVTSTDMVFVQRALFSTMPSEEPTEYPTEYLITPIEDTDNNHTTVIAVAVSVSVLLALIVIAAVFICLKKKLPIRPFQLYKILQKEGPRRAVPEAKFQQGVNDVGSQGEASVTLVTPS